MVELIKGMTLDDAVKKLDESLKKSGKKVSQLYPVGEDKQFALIVIYR